MFKFATNKLHGGGGGGGGGGGSSGQSAAHKALENAMGDLALASRRRQLMQKDLFAFNKIADKGFPAKPSAMDYDRLFYQYDYYKIRHSDFCQFTLNLNIT